MVEVFGSGVGLVPEVFGEGLAELGENVDAFGVGLVSNLVGEGFGTVQSGGERTIFVAIRDNDLNGFRFIAPGPGYLVAGAAEDSQKVVLINPTGFRTLTLESRSEMLSGKIRAMESSASHIFVMVENDNPAIRRLYVLGNVSGLPVVAEFDVDGLEQAYWIAVNEAAGVFAYPVGVGRIEIRRTTAPFDIVSSITGIGRSAVAKWFRFPSVQRNASPAVTHMLYDGDNVPDTLWTVTTGIFDQNANQAAPGDRGFTQHDNTIYLFGGTAPLSVGYREVPVPVDEVGFTLSAWLGGFQTQDDNALVEAEWRDDDDNILQTDALPTVSAADRSNLTGFLYKEISGIIPAGATKVRVVITMTRVSGTNNDGYTDGVFLSMESYEVNNPAYYYLYTLADDGAEASVSEYKIYEASAETREDFKALGNVHFDDAQNPVRIDDRGCSVVTRGSVTPIQPVAPVFRGAYQISNGFWATLWGYVNSNPFIVEQERRETGLTRNRIVDGTVEQQALLPTLFASGDINEAFVIYTRGEEIKWELQPQSGGGIAVTDYSIELTEEQVNTFDAFVVRQVYPGFLQYAAMDPLTVRKIASTNLGRLTLNNAGLQFDGQTQVRHTVEYNDDIPYQSAWYGRALACRIEGGAVQAHAEAGRASRILAPELGPELARGNLFQLYDFDVEIKQPIQPPEAQAQAGENLGRLVSAASQGRVLSASAEKWDDGVYTSVGRVAVWRNENGIQYFLGFIEPPPDWVRSSNMVFGRFNELNQAGDKIFITGKSGPGVAIFNISDSGVITYWKTLVFAEYTAIPDGQKGNEARISPDGNTLIMACGGFSTGTEPSHAFVLQTTDDWNTFTLLHDIVKPGTPTNNPMNTMDVSRDFTTFCASCWVLNEVYVFRSFDNWQTFTTYTLTNPAYYPFGVASGDFLGNPLAVNYDGYRLFIGAPFGDADYGSGPVVSAGSVELYQFNHEIDDYEYLGPLTPPVTLAPNDAFGSVFASYGGNRISVFANGLLKRYLYGINENEITLIHSADSIFLPAASGSTRFFDNKDTAVIGGQLADNGAKTGAGAIGIVNYSEEP